MTSNLSQGGFLAILAVFVGGVVRLLKTDMLNAFLAKLSLPPVPKRALPWLALTLGFAFAALESLLRGEKVSSAVAQGLYGVFSGSLAIGGDQTVGKLVETSPSPKPEKAPETTKQSDPETTSDDPEKAPEPTSSDAESQQKP